MVFMHFPQHLTEEEELLQKKYAKLKKKKKALAASRAPKQESAAQDTDATARKRTAEAAADATEQAKKLIKLGAIKVAAEKKDISFKRTKRLKEQDKTNVSFTPFSPHHSGEIEEDRPEGNKPRIKGLYDSFVSSRDSRFDRDRDLSRDAGHEREDPRKSRDPPKRGNTIYVYGHGIGEDMMRKTFSNFGEIVHINMEKDKNCGFVTYTGMESADQAIAEMDGTVVGETQLRVSMARRQPSFETPPADPSNSSWASIAANQSKQSSHQDTRDLVTYDDNDIF